MPAPPYSGGKIVPIRPSLPSSLIVDRGNSQASSHFMTFGAISRWANSRTVFFRCSCSSLSWKSKRYSPHCVTADALRHSRLRIPRFARDDKQMWACGSRSEFSDWKPRAGMAQNLAPNLSFKHGRQQTTKFSYRPVGLRLTALVRARHYAAVRDGRKKKARRSAPKFQEERPSERQRSAAQTQSRLKLVLVS